jgi:CRP/FNR family transcriptional regulator, cyclic AMP receptor protein
VHPARPAPVLIYAPRLVSMSRYVTGQEPIALPAGSVVFSEGEAGAVMYVVAEGEVEIRHGDMPPVRLGADATFGEMALIDKSVRSATAVAVTDVKLYEITRGLFLYLVQEAPMFALEVMQSLAERLRAANERIA